MCSKGKCLLKCCGGIKNVSSTATNIANKEVERARKLPSSEAEIRTHHSLIKNPDVLTDQMGDSKTVHVATETREAGTAIDKSLVKRKRTVKRLHSAANVKYMGEAEKIGRSTSRRFTDPEAREFGLRVFSQIASTGNLLNKDEQKVWDETAENVAEVLRARGTRLKLDSTSTVNLNDRFVPQIMKAHKKVLISI